MKYKVTVDFHVEAASDDNALELVFNELKDCDLEDFTPMLFNVIIVPDLSKERNKNGEYKASDENTDTTL